MADWKGDDATCSKEKITTERTESAEKKHFSVTSVTSVVKFL
jgi:hypothetical protein